MTIAPVCHQQGGPSVRLARATMPAEVAAALLYANPTNACLMASVGPALALINAGGLLRESGG